MPWHILLTTPGSEFKVRDELHRKGAWASVPVEFRLSKRKNHRPQRRPVLPGYCFAIIDNWSVLLQPTIRTVRQGADDFTHEPGAPRPIDGLRARPIVMLDGKPAILTEDEIAAVLLLSRPLAAIKSTGTKLRPGDRIKIKVGAFAELSALIDKVSTKGKVVAVVELFGRPSPVVLDRNEYEAA